MESIGTEIALIAALIAVNGFFAGAEAALIAVRRSQVDELASRGGKAAKTLQALKATPDRFLATVQVGVTVVGTLASVVSGVKVVRALTPTIAALPSELLRDWSEPLAIAIVVTVIAFASLVFGELVPKYLALARPSQMALFCAPPVAFLSRLGHPLVTALTVISRLVTRILGVRPTEDGVAVSDQEIRLLSLEGRRSGSLDEVEQQMIHQALDFSETKARQVMTPRPDIAAIDAIMPTGEMMTYLREEEYSRYPVYESSIDHIVGVLNIKDLVHHLGNGGEFVLRNIMRPVLFVPDSMPLSKVLKRFQSERRHLAIVLDEFGGTAGLLTLEDILEEIVGDIQDEYDAEPEEFKNLRDGSALVSAGMPVIDFNEQFNAQLPTDHGDTLSGLFISSLDRVPHRGDHIEIAGVRLDIATLRGRRVIRLRAQRIDAEKDQ